MIPPNVSLDGIKTISSEGLGVNPISDIIKLECQDCPFAERKDDGEVWIQGVDNSLLLRFDIAQEDHVLNLNGAQLYPPPFNNLVAPFSTYQVHSDLDLAQLKEHPELASPALRISALRYTVQSAQTVDASGADIIPLTFHIEELEGQKVNVPSLDINLLKDSEGRLIILSVDTLSAKTEDVGPKEEESKECMEWPLLCKWKSIVAEKVHRMKSSMAKGCHRGHGKLSHPDRPKHPHHGHHGHHGHRHNRWHKFHRVLNIIIPVVIGIGVGMATYVLGWAIGAVIALAWFTFRGSRNQYNIVVQDEEQADKDTEKQVYQGEAELEAPPAYESADKEVVV